MNVVRSIAKATTSRRQVFSAGRNRRLVERVLAQPQLVAAIADHIPLPRGYGRRYSEYCIEWPWALTRPAPGAVPDAGSTLNHVMDISGCTDGVASSSQPQAEALEVVFELWRVLRPGEVLLISRPVGVLKRFGSARHPSEADVAELLSRTPCSSTKHLFAHSTEGWHPSSWGAVASLMYRERSVGPLARDRATAARAVGCVEVRRP